MSEAEPATATAVVATMSDGDGGSQMWSTSGEDKHDQLITPDVQEEVALLDDQTQ